MNVLRDPFVQFAIGTTLAFASLIVSVCSLIVSLRTSSTQEKQFVNYLPVSRERTFRGCFMNILIIFSMLLAIAYFLLQILTGTQSGLYSYPPFIIAIFVVAIVGCIFLILINLIRLIRGTPQQQASSILEEQQQ